MEITVLFFGLLAEAVGTEKMTFKGLEDTDALVQHLLDAYPSLWDKKYRIALNTRVVNGKATLSEGDVVALLPPFAGG